MEQRVDSGRAAIVAVPVVINFRATLLPKEKHFWVTAPSEKVLRSEGVVVFQDNLPVPREFMRGGSIVHEIFEAAVRESLSRNEHLKDFKVFQLDLHVGQLMTCCYGAPSHVATPHRSDCKVTAWMESVTTFTHRVWRPAMTLPLFLPSQMDQSPLRPRPSPALTRHFVQ